MTKDQNIQALKESEERFRALVESTNDWAWEVDTKGVYTYASPQIEQLLGYQPKEIIGKTPFDLMLPDEAKKIAVIFTDIVKSKKPFTILENVNLHKDGREVVLETSGVPFFNEKGKLMGYRGIDRDITERKQAEVSLLESEKKYCALAENIPALVCTWKTGGILTFVNAAYCKYFNKTQNELIGKDFLRFIPRKNRKQVRKHFNSLTRQKPVATHEHKVVAPDGSIHWHQWTNRAIFGDNNTPVEYQSIGFDITERKQAESLLRANQQELAKAKNQLENRVRQRTAELAKKNKELRSEIAERKKAEKKLLLYQQQLRSLASELSLAEERLRRKIAIDVHDNVGQNLAISKIKLELLAKSITCPERAETLDEIRNLINQAIENTRLLTFELSPPVLYELGFESAVEWLLKNTRQRHKINTDLKTDGKPKPLSDNTRVLLFQAIREILVNIVKHAKADNVKVSIQKLNSRLKIKIVDDGVGFDLAQIESYDHKTDGFGLFSIRERLDQINGNINIDSKPNSGTTVTLTAPLSKNNKRGAE